MYVQTGGVEICVLLPVDCGNLFIHVGRLGDSILLVGSGRNGRV